MKKAEAIKRMEELETLLSDILGCLQFVIDREDMRWSKNIKQTHLTSMIHLAKRDALNAYKSYIIGRVQGDKLPTEWRS